MPNRRERGDWQTPEALAHEVLARVQAVGVAPPACVLEPTCGTGTFLAAAAEAFPNARLVGYELNAAYAKQARARVQASALAQVQVRVANFFELDWRRELAALPDGPLWIVGNPPWVTSATLGTLGSRNLPRKQNSAKLKGLDARTGKSNFDVSEWMLARLLEALHGRRDATLAMLCKASVARKLIVHATTNGLQLTPGGLWRIDSRAHFQAAVDAVLFVARTGGGESAPKEPLRWPVHDELRDSRPRALLQLQDGSLLADAAAFARTAQLAGRSEPAWRSGLKHDCARVMELRRDARGALRNGL
ncbi:MAG TPA: class I SAM-dependent methyltransferase, partial [Polyangiales bacterium]|nr:class I SAM-dependent methyltransferase [Polyangiales bacterium]